MITTDRVIEILCIAADFCVEYENEIQNHELQAVGTTKNKTQENANVSERDYCCNDLFPLRNLS